MKSFAVINYLLAIFAFAFISIADARVPDASGSGSNRSGSGVKKSNSARSAGRNQAKGRNSAKSRPKSSARGGSSTSNASRSGQANSINKAMGNIKKNFSNKNKAKVGSKANQKSGGSRYFTAPQGGQHSGYKDGNFHQQEGQHDGFRSEFHKQGSPYSSRENQHEVPHGNNFRRQEGEYSEHGSFRGRFREQDYQENSKSSSGEDKQDRLPNRGNYQKQGNNPPPPARDKVNDQRPVSKPKEKSWWNFFGDEDS